MKQKKKYESAGMEGEMSILLTPRWFSINPKALNHPVQKKFIDDFFQNKYHNYTIAAGRRSFKTERFGKRLLITQCLANKNKNYYAGGPTRQQAKEILWSDLKNLTPAWAVDKIGETELKIYFKWGTTLKVVGLREFKRVQGALCHGFLITEYQECDSGVYNQSIEPMLNDTHGWCIKEGRPFGKNHFFDDFLKGEKKQKGFGSYHWKSADILTDEQIERAKESLAALDYEREYEASFETSGQRPYYSYSPLNNHKWILKKNIPVIVACDFNATEKPMSWIVGQRIKVQDMDKTYWVKSISFTYTNTEMMCKILDEDYFEAIIKKQLGFYPKHVIFYGDYSGKKETSNSSYSDWQIIENYFRNKTKFEKRLKPCKSIRDSIASTNAQFCNTKGQRKQFVDIENCKEFVKDLEYCEWAENGRELKDNDPLLGHCCRAVDYYNDYEFSIKKSEFKQW